MSKYSLYLIWSLIVFSILLSVNAHAQLENIFVETYYVSDSLDATDTLGGGIVPGTTTYRVYVDLAPGYKLKKVYGNSNHRLFFSSSSPFFNNKEDGQTFGKDFSRIRLQENTVALDTWLTLGQVTKTGNPTLFGVPKFYDSNGSLVGGVNNDGGSEGIPGGLLVNTNPAAGIPLTQADGNDVMTVTPTNWANFGFLSTSGDDSTIFGSIQPATLFESYDAALQSSGVSGVNPDSNQVLVAQLTTSGTLAFELNIEVIDSNGSVTKYVAPSDIVLSDEVVFPRLKYPPACGCTDPNYLEFNTGYACLNPDSCKTLVVLGCLDPLACNYNPSANLGTPSLCCYVGACNGLDISLVCPFLSVSETVSDWVQIYPNPVQDNLYVQYSGSDPAGLSWYITDMSGRILQVSNNSLQSASTAISVAQYGQGTYMLVLNVKDSRIVKLFTRL